MNFEILVLNAVANRSGSRGPLVHYLVEDFLVQKPFFGINEPPRQVDGP